MKEHIHMTPPLKVTRKHLHDVLKNKCSSKVSQDKILVTVGSLQSDLILDHDIDVTRKTIREKGICPAGYFQKKYPKSISYKTTGSPDKRGMVIDPKQFLIDIEEYEDKEDLADDFETIRVCDRCEQFSLDWFQSKEIEHIICADCQEQLKEEFEVNTTEAIEKWVKETTEGEK